MNKIARYECVDPLSNIYYDRKTGNIIHNLELDKKDDIFYKQNICLYPWNVISKIYTSRLVTIIYVTLSLSLYFAFICFTINKIRKEMLEFKIYPLILYTPLFIVLSIILHEFSHAMSAISFNGIVTEMGICKGHLGLRYYTRAFWQNKSKTARVIYYLSGPALNSAVFEISAILFVYINNGMLFMIMAINGALTFFNAFPLIKDNDGNKAIRVLLRKL